MALRFLLSSLKLKRQHPYNSMPKYVFERWIDKKKVYRTYDTDKSQFICQTPKGKLYKKKVFMEFYLYHPVGTKKSIDTDITRDVPWVEADRLAREYAPKDLYDKIFRVWKKSTNSHTGPHSYVILDDRTRTMAMRHAHKLNTSVTQFVRMLIQKWDDYH